MPVYRDLRMLRRDLLQKERLNMILTPTVITMAIIMTVTAVMNTAQNITVPETEQEERLL